MTPTVTSPMAVMLALRTVSEIRPISPKTSLFESSYGYDSFINFLGNANLAFEDHVGIITHNPFGDDDITIGIVLVNWSVLQAHAFPAE